MEDNLNHFVYTRPVIEFVTVASEYCAFLEKTEQFSKKDFVDKIRKILPLLYLKMSTIEDINKENEGNAEKFVTEYDYTNIFNAVAAKLASHEAFVDVYEPGEANSEPVQVSIAECLADIYQDLKDFIANYQISTVEVMNDALWECRLNFEQFWGPRLLAALAAFHNIQYGTETLEDEQYKPPHLSAQDIKTDDWIISQRFKDFRENDE